MICEKRFEKNFAKVANILRLSQKYSKITFAKLQNIFRPYFVCLVSLANYRIGFKMFGQSCLPCIVLLTMVSTIHDVTTFSFA